jgi:hypothetical protein
MLTEIRVQDINTMTLGELLIERRSLEKVQSSPSGADTAIGDNAISKWINSINRRIGELESLEKRNL